MRFSVTDFGAIPNGGNVQTERFQEALDHCFFNGGGEVYVPAGGYIIGSIRVRSNTVLKLSAKTEITGSNDISDYELLGGSDGVEPFPPKFLPLVDRCGKSDERMKYWHHALIHIYNAENVSIIGEEGALINGVNLFDAKGEEGYRGPHCISVLESKNVYLAGYTIKNSANWAHCMWFCKDLTVENVRIYGGHDGIDFFASDNVSVRKCVLHTGDDCIAGYDNIGVIIEDCELNSSCSALRFSGADVVVKNCKVYGPGEYIHRNSLSDEEKISGVNADLEKTGKYRNNMLSFMTYYADERLLVRREPTNILITDCLVDNCDRFLHFNFSGNETWQKQTPLQDITFKNIKAENVRLPLTLLGDKNKPVSLKMENCDVFFSDGNVNNPLIFADNFEKIELKNVVCNNEYPSAIDIVGDGAGKTEIDGGNVLQVFKKPFGYKSGFKTQSI